MMKKQIGTILWLYNDVRESEAARLRSAAAEFFVDLIQQSVADPLTVLIAGEPNPSLLNEFCQMFTMQIRVMQRCTFIPGEAIVLPRRPHEELEVSPVWRAEILSQRQRFRVAGK